MPFTIGPWLLTCTRLTCSGGRTVGKGVARVQRLVAEPEGDAAAPGAHARLGDHLDAHHAGVVVLGGVRVGAEADLLDLVLRRQPAAAEPVDEDLRARTGHLRELLGHLVGIVRERVDLLLRQRGGEAVVAPLGGVGLGDLSPPR